MRVQESMRRLQVKDWIVRLWIAGWDREAADAIARLARDVAELSRDTQEAADRIALLALVNAVEVIDTTSQEGHLVYPSWP